MDRIRAPGVRLGRRHRDHCHARRERGSSPRVPVRRERIHDVSVRLVFEPCPLPPLTTDLRAARRHHDAALAHEQAGRLFEAQAAWTAAIDAAPLEDVLWIRRALCRKRRGDLWGSWWDTTRAVLLEGSQVVVALTNRGTTQLLRGLPDEALADFEEALRRAPDWPDGHIGRAKIRIARGQPDAARADLRRALDLCARDPAFAASARTAGELLADLDAAAPDPAATPGR